MDKVASRALFRAHRVDSSISEKAVRTLFSLKEYKNAPLILSYVPLPDEIAMPLALGYALPFIKGDEMEFALFKGALVKGKYGIAECEKKEKITSFPKGTLIIVPALSFDESGYRVGRGMGYYDRFLKRNKDLLKLGLIPKERILKIDDIGPDDAKMDLIVTECGALYF